MEEIKNEEQIVVTTQANTDENNSQNIEGGETKKPFKKRKPKPKVPKDPQALQQTKGEGWITDLKKAYLVNEKIHRDRLNPHYKLNLNTAAKIKITPLGGLGEIGGNMMVVETETQALIIDVGMSFPDENMHGVDILIPDFTYIREIK
jgi:ribonuclease J